MMANGFEEEKCPGEANEENFRSLNCSERSTSSVTSEYDESTLEKLKPLPGENVVYWGSGSPQAWRVLIALEEKGIPYRDVCVSFSSGILKSSFFLNLNPRGMVPIFVDGSKNTVLYESIGILEYLDQVYPNPPLMPRTPEGFAIAQTRLHEALSLSSVYGEVICYMRRVPRERRNQTICHMKWIALDNELQIWEKYLEGKVFLCGNQLTLADLSVFTNLAYAVRCGLELDGFYPRLFAYYMRMCLRPSVDKTWPPHWRTIQGQPVLQRS